MGGPCPVETPPPIPTSCQDPSPNPRSSPHLRRHLEAAVGQFHCLHLLMANVVQLEDTGVGWSQLRCGCGKGGGLALRKAQLRQDAPGTPSAQRQTNPGHRRGPGWGETPASLTRFSPSPLGLAGWGSRHRSRVTPARCGASFEAPDLSCITGSGGAREAHRGPGSGTDPQACSRRRAPAVSGSGAKWVYPHPHPMV